MARQSIRLVLCFLLLPCLIDGYSRYTSVEEAAAALDAVPDLDGLVQDLLPRPPARFCLVFTLSLLLMAGFVALTAHSPQEQQGPLVAAVGAPQQVISHPRVYLAVMLFAAAAAIVGLSILPRFM